MKHVLRQVQQVGQLVLLSLTVVRPISISFVLIKVNHGSNESSYRFTVVSHVALLRLLLSVRAHLQAAAADLSSAPSVHQHFRVSSGGRGDRLAPHWKLSEILILQTSKSVSDGAADINRLWQSSSGGEKSLDHGR